MMKKTTKFTALLSGAALLASSGFAQDAVSTTPVGYVTVPVKGGGATSIISSAGLLQGAESAGIATVSGGTALTVSGANSFGGDYAGSHYVHLGTGEWATIAANSETTLTLESSLSDGVDVTYSIHALNTLDSLFGSTNSAGFTGGANLGVSDIIAPWDLGDQNFAGFYYYNTSRERWEDASNNSAGSTILYPDESLVVIGVNDVNITFTGTVQVGQTSGGIAGGSGTSIVPNPYPVDLKITEAGYETSLQGASTFGEADWVLLWDQNAQNFSKFFFYDTDDNKWKDSGNNDATDVDVIPAGCAAVIVKNSTGDVDWNMNQPFSLNN